MKTEKNTIKTPEEVRKLMEDLWLNHKAGNKIPKNNVFWIQLPPLTKEDKTSIKTTKEDELKASKENDQEFEDVGLMGKNKGSE